MKSKNEILSILKEIKPKYEEDGLIILGLFGSVAKDRDTKFSDIDIAYHLNYEEFSQKYRDGFSKILRIEDIKEELQTLLESKIDFVPDKNRDILEELIYV